MITRTLRKITNVENLIKNIMFNYNKNIITEK